MITRRLEDVAALAGGSVLAAPGSEVEVTNVVTDSRQAGPGSLFVAIAGERTDGHAHLADVARSGAAAALVCDLPAARAALAQEDLGERSLALIHVQDTVEALGHLAAGHLADLRAKAREAGTDLTVVAMTGSVGKTTTKDLTRQLLATQAPTVAPVASFNNEIGLPLTVLKTDETTRYLVLEMGASGPGHIAYLTGIAPLDAAAVLMIGHAHMGGFGSVEGVAKAKEEIVQGLLPAGTAVLNRDDERAWAMRETAPGPVLTFSAIGDELADLRAENLEVDEQAHASFDLVLPGAVTRRVRLALPGVHNVANALAAAGLALVAGAEPEAVAAGLSDARMESPHRMDVRRVAAPEDGELTLIDDSYNANIDSMTAALRSLPALAGQGRRVVVVSEMLELGQSAEADHQRTGELAAELGTRLLVTIGAGAEPAARAARAGGVPEVIELPDAATAIEQVDSLLRTGDAVLVKGSHGSGAWRVADHLRERAAVTQVGTAGNQEEPLR